MLRVRSLLFPLALVLGLAACGSSGASSTSNTGGAGTGGSGGRALAADEVSCEGRVLLKVPDDPAAEGPWPVGARTITVAGYTTEVWYPAQGVSPAPEPATLALLALGGAALMRRKK